MTQDCVFPIPLCLAWGREYGIMVILGARIIGDVIRFVLNSVQYHLIFSLPDDESVTEARRTLMLPPGAERMLPGSPPGRCLFRRSQCAWPHAILATVDPLPAYRGPRPSSDAHPYVPSLPLDEMPHVKDALEAAVARHRAGVARQAKQERPWLPDAAYRLLQCGSEHVWLPVAQVWKLSGKDFAIESQRSAYKKLRDLEFAEFENVQTGSRRMKLMEIQPAGWEHLGKRPPAIRGRGGITHRHVAHWIARWLEQQGLEAEIEVLVPHTTHHTDVGSRLLDGRLEAWEVVVGCDDNMAAAARACLIDSDAVARMVVVVLEKKRIVEVRAIIEADEALRAFGDRIRYELAEKFIPEV